MGRRLRPEDLGQLPPGMRNIRVQDEIDKQVLGAAAGEPKRFAFLLEANAAKQICATDRRIDLFC